ncbi:MAG TPA: hypothetical protein VI750_02520 [Pyrinomonadaceae bacterium]|nr:hypothetical protein [Pyrinomonadaceae bacterium]
MYEPRKDRITGKRLEELRKLVIEIVDEPCNLGIRGAASLMSWHPGTLHRIYSGRWKEVKVYPEHAQTIEIAHTVAMRHSKLVGEARELSKKLVQQGGEFAKTAAQLRTLLKKKYTQ